SQTSFSLTPSDVAPPPPSTVGVAGPALLTDVVLQLAAQSCHSVVPPNRLHTSSRSAGSDLTRVISI
ncbi:unnamed protein product, partial [Citrullus colocynthis]